MATATDPTLAAAPIAKPTLASLIDRWIYVFMAVLLIAVTLTGFVPDSFAKVALVENGGRPPFPAVLHVHALTTGAWLLLLLTQAVLGATGRFEWHKALGMTALVLGPLLVIDGVLVALAIYHQVWDTAHAAPGIVDPLTSKPLIGQAHATLFRIKNLTIFSVLLVIALRLRRSDPATHKRLMILIPLSIMVAAISRWSCLPEGFLASPAALQAAAAALALPMFAWDLYRQGQVQRAYVIWMALYLPFSLLVIALWDSPWWHGLVPHLMGMA